MTKYFYQIFFKFQCYFPKGFINQNCFLYVIENWKESLDQGGHYDALLADLSKAFDCIVYNLLIAIVDICNYFLGQERRIKISSCSSTWSKIECGVSQGSILGRLLFNINALDMFFKQKDVKFAAYAGNNTSYFCDKNHELLLSKLQICALKLLEWFSNNYMKINSKNCHLFLVLMMKIRK